MNQNTKQRIVGTLVLLALALIFLPIIFDGGGTYQRPVSSRIPTPPDVPVMPEPNPQRPLLENEPAPTVVLDSVPEDLDPDLPVIEPADTAQEVVTTVVDATATNPSSATEPPEVTEATPEPVIPAVGDESLVVGVNETTPPTLDEQGLPVGWSVRLGSFSNATNADALLKRLLADEYRAYTRQVTTSQGTFTAVFVGPLVERERVEALRRELQQKFNLNGMVVRFTIDPL